MPTSCSAFGCKNRFKFGENIQYFGFPLKKKELLDAWVIAVRRLDFIPTKSSKICSAHFEESDYLVRPGTYVKHLKSDAVPSIFPAFPEHLQKKKKKKIFNGRSKISNGVSVQIKVDSNVSDQIVDEIPASEENSTFSSIICKLDKSSQTDANYKSDLKKKIKTLQQKVRRQEKTITNFKDLLSKLRGKNLIQQDT